jgi:hypothetical protein
MVEKMKKATLLLMLVALVMQGCKEEKERVLLLENPTEKMLIEEPVTLTRAELEKKWGAIPAGTVPMLTNTSGEIMPSQVDDLDGDGKWDELFFLHTLPPGMQATVMVSYVEPSEMPKFTTRTNIRMAKIEGDNYVDLTRAPRVPQADGTAGGVYQLEGPGWENDIVGFRNYLDARNGMDIFGKVITDMVLDRAGINEDYHLLQDWGYDILRVGASLGSGSIAVEIDGELIRVAPQAKGDFELVSEGPLRSILRLNFTGWDVKGKNYDLVHEVSITAGKWFYDSKVFFPGLTGEITLVAGITTIDLGDKDAYMKDFEGKITTVATHGEQSYDYENLGMAIMVSNDYFSGIGRVGADAVDINNSVLVKMAVKDANPVSFRFYSCWVGSDERFADEDYFIDFLTKEAEKMAFPISVTLN